MNVLLAVPTRREAAALLGDKLVCGVGAQAGEALAARLERERPDAVVIAGVCGGLDPSLHAGDLVLATRVLAPKKPDLAPEPALIEAVQRRLRTTRRRFTSAALVTADRPVANRDEKRDLWNTHAAAGVDMETYAIAEAAAAHGLPWFVLRAVVDPAGATLPAPIRAWRGEGDERALMLALLRRPQEWYPTARLALQMRHALDALARSVPLALAAAAALPAPDAEDAPVR